MNRTWNAYFYQPFKLFKLFKRVTWNTERRTCVSSQPFKLSNFQTLQTLQTRNTEHGTQNMCLFPTLQTLKLSNSSNTEHGTRNMEHGTRNSILSEFVKIFHFLLFKEFIDTTQVFTNLFIAYLVYFSHQSIQELTVVGYDDGCSVVGFDGIFQYFL